MGRHPNSSSKPSHSKLHLRGSQNTYYKVRLSVDFSPILPSYIHPPPSSSLCSILPTFNSDKLTFTSAFIIPYNGVDQQRDRQKHQKKYQQYVSQIDQQQIMVPKPRNKDYCHVCQRHFDDYQEHIESGTHHEAVSRNIYHKHIRKLCKRYRRKEIKRYEGRVEDKQDSQEQISRNMGSEAQFMKQNQQEDVNNDMPFACVSLDSLLKCHQQSQLQSQRHTYKVKSKYKAQSPQFSPQQRPQSQPYAQEQPHLSCKYNPQRQLQQSPELKKQVPYFASTEQKQKQKQK